MEVLGLIDIPTWLLVIILLLVSAYMYGTRTHGAFDGYGIPGPKPYPFIGTMGQSFIKGFLDADVELMQKFGKLVTMFIGPTPSIFTSDEDLIKAICVKEFQNFPERMAFDSGDQLSSDMLSVASGDQWRRLRHLMSPTFSTGKLRKMNFQVNRCSRLLSENMAEYAESGKSCEIKSTIQAFTMDTIAATAFGLELNSQKTPDNPFVKMGKKAFDVNVFNPALLVAFFFPELLPLLGKLKLSFFPKDMSDFFSELTEKAIKERKADDSKQVDFLQLMINAHEDNDAEDDATDPAINNGVQDVKIDRKRGMTHRELLAQAVLFFVAGFETTAQTMTHLCYSLATNPEIQEKLYQEVKNHVGDEESLDYNLVSQIGYLDQCVNETLRLYPAAFRTDRMCVKDTTIKGIHFKKGWSIGFPIYAMHRDPNIWEDPDAFKPERFEDMSKIGYSFMPFGQGPRNCIGMRLALMEIKIAIAILIKDFKLIQTKDTLYPLKFHPRKFMQPIKPLLIGVEKRA